jgi:hypothetical protein
MTILVIFENQSLDNTSECYIRWRPNQWILEALSTSESGRRV